MNEVNRSFVKKKFIPNEQNVTPEKYNFKYQNKNCENLVAQIHCWTEGFLHPKRAMSPYVQ